MDNGFHVVPLLKKFFLSYSVLLVLFIADKSQLNCEIQLQLYKKAAHFPYTFYSISFFVSFRIILYVIVSFQCFVLHGVHLVSMLVVLCRSETTIEAVIN